MTLYEDATVDIGIWKKHFDNMQENKVDAEQGFYSVKEEQNPAPDKDTKLLKTIKLETPLEQTIEIAKTDEDIMKPRKKCGKGKPSKKGKKSTKKCKKTDTRKTQKKKKKNVNKHFSAW